MRRLLFLFFLAPLMAACGAASSPEVGGQAISDSAMSTSTTAPRPDDTVRVSPSVLADIDASIPDNAGAIDLGPVAPADDTSFCQAFAAAPVRWLNDALIPIQYWVDNFTAARPVVPEVAAEPVDRLLAHGDDMLAWQFGRLDERPTWTSSLADDAVTLADIAVAECPDLPLVVGSSEEAAASLHFGERTPDEVCAGEASSVAKGIQWYVDELGVAPEHQQQIETATNRALVAGMESTGELPDDVPIYFGSSYYGVGPGAEPLAVPGGACDL